MFVTYSSLLILLFQIVSCGKDAQIDYTSSYKMSALQEGAELNEAEFLEYMTTTTAYVSILAGLSRAAGIDFDKEPKIHSDKLFKGVDDYNEKLRKIIPQMIGKEPLFSCLDKETDDKFKITLVAADPKNTDDIKMRKALFKTAKEKKIIVAVEGLSNAAELTGEVKSRDGFEFSVEKDDPIHGLENHHVYIADLLMGELKSSLYNPNSDDKTRDVEVVNFARFDMVAILSTGGFSKNPVARAVENQDLKLSAEAKEFLMEIARSQNGRKPFAKLKEHVLAEIFSKSNDEWTKLIKVIVKEHLHERFGHLSIVDEIVAGILNNKRKSIHEFEQYYFANLEMGNIDRAITISNLYCKALQQKKNLFVVARSIQVPGIFNYLMKSKLHPKSIHVAATQKHWENVQEELEILKFVSKNSKSK